MENRTSSKLIILAVLSLIALTLVRIGVKGLGEVGSIKKSISEYDASAQFLQDRVDLTTPCLTEADFGKCYYTSFVESPLSRDFAEKVRVYPYRKIISSLNYNSDARRALLASEDVNFERSDAANNFNIRKLFEGSISQDANVRRDSWNELSALRLHDRDRRLIYELRNNISRKETICRNVEDYVDGQKTIDDMLNYVKLGCGTKASHNWFFIGDVYVTQIVRARLLLSEGRNEESMKYLKRAINIQKRAIYEDKSKRAKLSEIADLWIEHFPDDFHQFVDSHIEQTNIHSKDLPLRKLAEINPYIIAALKYSKDKKRVKKIESVWKQKLSNPEVSENHREALIKSFEYQSKTANGGYHVYGPRKLDLEYLLSCPKNEVGIECLNRAKQLDVSKSNKAKIVSASLILANALYKHDYKKGQTQFIEALNYANDCVCLSKMQSGVYIQFDSIALHELKYASTQSR